MRHYFDTVEDRVTGRPVAGAQVYVRTAPIAEGGVNATIYSDDETVPTAITQPIVTGQDGFFSFYAPDGRYCLQIYYNGSLIRTLEDVEVSNSLSDAIAAAASAAQAAASATMAASAFETGLPQLEAFADAAAASADEAEGFAQALFVNTFGLWYDSLAAGAAAVDEGEGYIVIDSGIVTIGKKVGGVGVAQAEFATMAAFLAELSGIITVDEVQTLTNKTIDLGDNSVTGTTAQFNDALSDGSFATLAGAETLTNKTISLGNNTLSGTLAQFNTAVSDADLASTAALAATTGAALIGKTGGGTVQDALDAISAEWTQIATATPTGTGTVDFTSIPATYSDLLLVVDGASHNDAGTPALNLYLSDNGTNWTGAAAINASTSAAALVRGAVLITGYRMSYGVLLTPMGTINLSSARMFTTVSPAVAAFWRVDGGITAVRVSWDAGNYDAGTITLYGR